MWANTRSWSSVHRTTASNECSLEKPLITYAHLWQVWFKQGVWMHPIWPTPTGGSFFLACPARPPEGIDLSKLPNEQQCLCGSQKGCCLPEITGWWQWRLESAKECAATDLTKRAAPKKNCARACQKTQLDPSKKKPRPKKTRKKTWNPDLFGHFFIEKVLPPVKLFVCFGPHGSKMKTEMYRSCV